MKLIYSFLIALFAFLGANANVTMPGIFGNDMVLQRNKPIPVWGWAKANETIVVSLNTQKKTVKADRKGNWMVKLSPENAGGPFSLTIQANNTITFSNVLIGEVWICSGQSNMEWPLSASNNANQEISNANYPQIRHITVTKAVSSMPQKDIKGGSWEVAEPRNAGKFSAVAYFFARKLYQELKVPIGLINTSWGGTHIETWTSREAFQGSEEFKSMIASMPSLNMDSLARIKSATLAKDISALTLGPNEYPSLLYNAMLYPLIPFAIQGAIWYQGESNAGRAWQYRQAFPLMINDWRKQWKQGDFPFYFVQLASFDAGGSSDKQSGYRWAELREAQTLTLSLPNTGMAVTSDVGEVKDIHPRNKQDVGLRLALAALSGTYKKNTVGSGPMYQSMKTEGNKVTISFTNIGSGLMTKDKYGYLKGFEISGADQKYCYAKAYLQGNKVIVYADDVTAPIAVRFGWFDDLSDNNLYNTEGLPTVPFRTDNWERVTVSEKFKIQ